jgi:hypothetical protein
VDTGAVAAERAVGTVVAAERAGAVAADVVAAADVVESGRTLMRTFHFLESRTPSMNVVRVGLFLRRLLLALMVAVPLTAAAAPQETFATPEAAVDALMAALKADSDPAMLAIFG